MALGRNLAISSFKLAHRVGLDYHHLPSIGLFPAVVHHQLCRNER